MIRQKLAIEAKLNDCHGKLSRQWFVYYSVFNRHTGKLERKRIFKGLTGRTEAGRSKAAEKICAELNSKLHEGWNPLVDEP